MPEDPVPGGVGAASWGRPADYPPVHRHPGKHTAHLHVQLVDLPLPAHGLIRSNSCAREPAVALAHAFKLAVRQHTRHKLHALSRTQGALRTFQSLPGTSTEVTSSVLTVPEQNSSLLWESLPAEAMVSPTSAVPSTGLRTHRRLHAFEPGSMQPTPAINRRPTSWPLLCSRQPGPPEAHEQPPLRLNVILATRSTG